MINSKVLFFKKHAKSVTVYALLMLLTIQNSFAQDNEIGFGLGALTYTGEVIDQYNITANRPAATIFYRKNLNYASALKASLTGGQLQASDAKYGKDVFAKNRNFAFDVILIETSMVYEYNFLDFRNPKERIRISPYVFGGIGVSFITGHGTPQADFSPVQLNIPFGVGFKYRLSTYWQLDGEFGARRTFTDYIDNLSEGNPKVKNFQTGNKFDNDYYYYAGLSLTYTFWRVKCAFDFY